MNFAKNEKTLLNLIKYGPLLFVTVLSLIITFVFIEHQRNTFKNESIKLKEKYILSNLFILRAYVSKIF